MVVASHHRFNVKNLKHFPYLALGKCDFMLLHVLALAGTKLYILSSNQTALFFHCSDLAKTATPIKHLGRLF